MASVTPNPGTWAETCTGTRHNERIQMKRKIDSNNLIPWFTDDHGTLPAAYVASCQRFFLELDRRQADKQQATSAKLQAPSLTDGEG